MFGKPQSWLFSGYPDHQAIKGPNLNIIAVNKPERLVGSLGIVGTFDDFWWPNAVSFRVDKIEAICGHAHSLNLRRERYRTLSHRRLTKVAASDRSQMVSSRTEN
jgi:hypothetical protein